MSQETGWVNGAYGSCSGCDAFEAEFGWSWGDGCEDHTYDKQDDCLACQKRDEEYQEKLAEFGKGYLDTVMTQEQMEKYTAGNAEWSMEDKEALEWIKSFA